jgi:diguanylate cyclase (GGDEF)-like protein
MTSPSASLPASQAGPTAVTDSPTLAWRALAALFFAGATMGTLSLLLPHPMVYDEPGLWSNVALAYAAGAGLLLGARVLPAWAIQVFVLLGVLTITRAVYLSHDPSGYYSVWYVWVGLYSFFFLGLRWGVLGVALVGISYAWVLAELPGESDTIGRWTMTLVTVGVGGIMVNTLAGRLRNLAERHAAIAGERAQLMVALEEAARTDDLTGLPNRRAWDEELTREVRRAAREAVPLCVAVIDLDRFKEFNDLLGHQAGDRFLKTVSAAWRERLRSTDVLARYGGEEFALALPGCDTRDALELLERLRAGLPDAQTCSAGVAEWNGEEAPHDLLGRADRALYAAKEAGRDRIMVAA